MAVKLRLQRHGKKGKPFYHVVAADSRTPRDGKFIEKIGTYNPTTVPASIDLNLDAAVKWLQNGAEPTNTVRAILSYKGALYKNHLLNGVRKGALTEEQAESKFQSWLDDKTQKIGAHKDRVSKTRDDEKQKKLAAEREVKEKRLAEYEAAKKAQEDAAAEAVAETEASAETTSAAEDTPVENTENTAAEETAAE